jgi:hypothetical protein
VYTRSGTTWTARITLTPPAGSQFIPPLSIQNGHVFTGVDNGVMEFRGSGSYWSLGTLLPNIPKRTCFVSSPYPRGYDLAISGNTFVRGNCTDSAAATNAGAADFVRLLLPPIIKPVTDDNYLNRANATSGAAVTGTADPNSTIKVLLSKFTKTVKANTAGAWSVSFTGADIASLADGKWVLAASQTDAAGHLSQVQTVRMRKDVVPPTAPTIDPVTADNIVTAAERNPLVITGRTTANTAVDLIVDTMKGTVQSDSTGKWVYIYQHKAFDAFARRQCDGQSYCGGYCGEHGNGNTSI